MPPPKPNTPHQLPSRNRLEPRRPRPLRQPHLAHQGPRRLPQPDESGPEFQQTQAYQERVAFGAVDGYLFRAE